MVPHYSRLFTKTVFPNVVAINQFLNRRLQSCKKIISFNLYYLYFISPGQSFNIFNSGFDLSNQFKILSSLCLDFQSANLVSSFDSYVKTGTKILNKVNCYLYDVISNLKIIKM